MVASGTVTLHGASPENPGIQECYDLVEEFKRALSGTGPPPANAPDAGSGADGETTPGEAPASGESPEKVREAEASMLAQLAGEAASASGESIDPSCTRVLEESKRDLDKISLCFSADAALEAMKRHCGQRIVVLVDLPTSRKMIISQAIALASKLRAYTTPEKCRIIVNVHKRFDLFESVPAKIAQTFLEQPCLITVTKADVQTMTYKPSYIFATTGGEKRQPTVIKVFRTRI